MHAGTRCVRLRTSGDKENSSVFHDDSRQEREDMGNHVTADARDKHDVPGPALGERAGNDSRIREVQSFKTLNSQFYERP